HLAAIAHTQRKGVATCEEGSELLSKARAEKNGTRPALARTQGIAIAEAATSDKALVVAQASAAGLQVAHVHIKGVEACSMQGIAHLDLAIDTLLAQDSELGSGLGD